MNDVYSLSQFGNPPPPLFADAPPLFADGQHWDTAHAPASMIDVNLLSFPVTTLASEQTCGTDSVSSSAQLTESSTSSWNEVERVPELRSHRKRKLADKSGPEAAAAATDEPVFADKMERRRYTNRMAAREARARKRREHEQLEKNCADLQELCNRLTAENARLRARCSCGAVEDEL